MLCLTRLADLVDEMGRGKSAEDISHFAKSIDATLNIETSSKTGKAVCNRQFSLV